jgi:murein DD-endopeptidase MepM/ murein hydrolase activator NlpD
LSPADGIVVKVNNHIRDYTGVGDHSIDWKTWDFRGNFVVIKHADKEFSFLAHLRKDSILVKKGDFVRAGQVIGLCGNSGHSTEPHLHFHLQNNRNFWFTRGLPIVFKNAAVASKLNADFYPLTTHIDGECFVKTDQ